MELVVYTVLFIGLLASFSVIVVFGFARIPIDVLKRGEHARRFADLGSARVHSPGKPAAGSPLTGFDVPKAHAA
jgi:hypothetical protein